MASNRTGSHLQLVHLLWSATVACALLLNVLWPPYPGYSIWALSLVAYPVAAALILSNRPANRVGRVLAVVATAAGVIFVGGWVASTWQTQSWSGYVEAIIAGAAPILFWGAIALLYIFPTGQAPGRSFRLAYMAFTVVIGVMTILAPFDPDTPTLTGRPNPLAGPAWVGGIYDFGVFALAPGLIGGVWATISRFRSALSEVRAQLRWFLSGIVSVVGLVIVVAFIPEDLPSPYEALTSAVVVIGFWWLPASIVIAVTRYHLYEIDKLISRTISYTVVAALLAGVFFGLVVTTGSLLQTNDPVAVAAATLAVAALFNPLRRRIQNRVDRRFNRSGYQAEKVSEGFAARLREPLSSQEIMALSRMTIEEAMQPHAVGIWLKDVPASPTNDTPAKR